MITTDVLIIGCGAAGIRAASAAAQSGAAVMLVTGEPIAAGGSTFSNISRGWGIQAVFGEDRTNVNLDSFNMDVLDAGLGQCDPALVEILVEESGAAIEYLLACGIRFRANPDGSFLRSRGCFSTVPRAYIADDFKNIQSSFMSILQRCNVKVLTGSAVDLIMFEGECLGATVMIPGGENLAVRSLSTVLATGGGAGLFIRNFAGDIQVGDGYALAHRVGARLRNMEFIQFMLGVVASSGEKNFFPLGELSTPGVLGTTATDDLLDKQFPDSESRDKAFLERKRHFPFSSRDSSGAIDIAIAGEIHQQRPVYWEKSENRSSFLEVDHFAHAFNGGVIINNSAESSVPGLFAAGEIAAGPHGADRVGGCMMTATLVFGRRAGRSAAKRALKRNRRSLPDIRIPGGHQRVFSANEANGGDYLAIEKQVKKAMQRYGGVVRSRVGLEKGLAILQDSAGLLEQISKNEQGGAASACRVRNMITTATIILEAALGREASLGPHFRSDKKTLV